MKTFNILIFLTFLICSCNQENDKINDWKRKNVKGKVSQIITKIYGNYKQLQDKNDVPSNIIRFDTLGNLTDIIEELQMEQKRWIKYFYNNDTLWISQVLHLGPGNLTPEKFFLYKLKDNYKYSQCISYGQDTSVNYYIDYEVSNDEELLKFRKGNNPFYVPCKIVRKLNKSGLTAEEYNYPIEADGKCSENPIKTTFIYNENNDLQRQKRFNTKGELESNISFEYRYDNNKNWIYRIVYNGDIPGEVVIRDFLYY